MGRRGYPPEFRRKVLDLVEAGRPIAEVAQALGISAQSIYTWRRQDRIDRALLPGLSSPELDELAAARRRIAQSESGFYAWRSRPPSARAIRHAWLTDVIRQVHTDSRQTYGSRRIHAELTLGRGISVGYHAVELLMRRAGLQGVTGRPKYRRGLRPEATARDLVQRQFARTGPDQLWGHRHHRTPQPRRQGLLRGGAGCLLASGEWLVA